jgi:orotate phosphoribosyltransferase
MRKLYIIWGFSNLLAYADIAYLYTVKGEAEAAIIAAPALAALLLAAACAVKLRGEG